MRMRPLGSLRPLVAELALGTMVFGEQGGRGTPTEEVLRIIGRYLDAAAITSHRQPLRRRQVGGNSLAGHKGAVTTSFSPPSLIVRQ